VGLYRNVVDPAFAEVNRLELVQGRFIGDEDVAGSPRVAVLNETAAERLWPGRSALGRTVRTGGRDHEVVGVVRDGVYAFTFEEPKAYAWYPDTQRYRPGRTLHVRSADLSALPGRIQEIVRSLDPAVAVQSPVPMTQVVSSNQFMPRFLWKLTAAFALTGLLLACLGVYGMLSVHVARRKREFGVRMALGARAAQILALVMGRGARLAGVGCLLGLVGAFATARLLSALLYGVPPFDWVTFVGVPVLLLATAVLASLWPARRATRVDPRTALQEL
jgi:ABC-type antimicrobial peptide transport system permease subunit